MHFQCFHGSSKPFTALHGCCGSSEPSWLFGAVIRGMVFLKTRHCHKFRSDYGSLELSWLFGDSIHIFLTSCHSPSNLSWHFEVVIQCFRVSVALQGAYGSPEPSWLFGATGSSVLSWLFKFVVSLQKQIFFFKQFMVLEGFRAFSDAFRGCHGSSGLSWFF